MKRFHCQITCKKDVKAETEEDAAKTFLEDFDLEFEFSTFEVDVEEIDGGDDD